MDEQSWAGPLVPDERTLGMSQEFSFTLSFDDFDLSLLGDPPPDRDSDEFGPRVTAFFAKQFEGFGGLARVTINDDAREIQVRWTKQSHWKDPKEKILDLLNRGETTKALPLLWTAVKQDPKDTNSLYRLGLVYNELRQFKKASETLERLVNLVPNHIHGLTALGVAEIGSGNLLIAEEWLNKAIQLAPQDRWALRNLSGCLMKQGRHLDAITMIRRCLVVAPDDIAMIVGLGDAYEALGHLDEAERLFTAAIQTGGPEHVVDIAKDRLTRMSEAKLRSSSSELRPDVVRFILDALHLFDSMTPQQIQSLALEIALLGNQGLNVHDPSKKYHIKTLAGEFTGLHLISIMYAAFQEFAPQQDVGIDLSKEYAEAKQNRR